MPSQCSPQNQASQRSRLVKKSKKTLATMSWLYLTTSTTAAFSARSSTVAFVGKNFRSSQTTAISSTLLSKSPRESRPHQPSITGARFLSSTQLRRSSILAASESPEETYDILNKKRGLDKYEPASFENEIYQWWEKAGCFEPDAKQRRVEGEKPYVLPMPPPNVTGRLHMGHAIFVALQDVLARFHRMRGRPVLWLPGTSDFKWHLRLPELVSFSFCFAFNCASLHAVFLSRELI